MIGVVIVTHGQLANELVAAAEMIIGEIVHITAVSIGWHDDVDAAREEIERAIERVNDNKGVLLMTDMFGGTPTNIAATFLGIPVSTTHTVTGSVVGVGAARKVSAVRWNVASNIVTAWIITLPASASMAALCYLLSKAFG